MKRLLAVLGKDTSKSLSPLLHGAAAEACNLAIAYVPVSCPDADHFHRAVQALRTLGAVGCNVTIPYKNEALELAERSSTTAQEIGAVNTLTFSDDGRVQGDNTDGPGLVRVLQHLPPGTLARVQILGAGGAAKAAAWAASRAGAEEILVCARQNADKVSTSGAHAHGLARIKGATLVVSALPNDRALAKKILSSWIDEASHPYVLDLAYGDLTNESPLVLGARAAGLDASDGRSMLVEQASLSLALWTGGEVSRIRAAMRHAIGLSP
jgi:shikimate dehydrogenase